jgi:hypothetical protein
MQLSDAAEQSKDVSKCGKIWFTLVLCGRSATHECGSLVIYYSGAPTSDSAEIFGVHAREGCDSESNRHIPATVRNRRMLLHPVFRNSKTVPACRLLTRRARQPARGLLGADDSDAQGLVREREEGPLSCHQRHRGLPRPPTRQHRPARRRLLAVILSPIPRWRAPRECARRCARRCRARARTPDGQQWAG